MVPQIAFAIVVAVVVATAAVSLVAVADVGDYYSNFEMELQFADVVDLIEPSSSLVLESNL